MHLTFILLYARCCIVTSQIKVILPDTFLWQFVLLLTDCFKQWPEITINLYWRFSSYCNIIHPFMLIKKNEKTTVSQLNLRRGWIHKATLWRKNTSHETPNRYMHSVRTAIPESEQTGKSPIQRKQNVTCSITLMISCYLVYLMSKDYLYYKRIRKE